MKQITVTYTLNHSTHTYIYKTNANDTSAIIAKIRETLHANNARIDNIEERAVNYRFSNIALTKKEYSRLVRSGYRQIKTLFDVYCDVHKLDTYDFLK